MTGRLRRRCRRCRRSGRDRRRRGNRPCSSLPRLSRTFPWSSCRPWAGYLPDTSPARRYWRISSSGRYASRALDLAAETGGNAEPVAVGLAEIFDRVVNLAVLLDDRGHDVVDGLEQFGIGVRQPSRHGQNIVAGLGLRFGGDGHEEFVALARDVVDPNLDLCLFSPFIDEISQGLVSAGDPVIPETYRQFAGRVSAAHVRRGDERCGCRGGSSYELSSRQFS